jgi:hypothetical protein
MALGSTQPLTEMGTRNLPGGKERPAREDANLTAICEPTVYKCESLDVSQPYGPSRRYRDSFTFTLPALWRYNYLQNIYSFIKTNAIGIFINSWLCFTYNKYNTSAIRLMEIDDMNKYENVA